MLFGIVYIFTVENARVCLLENCSFRILNKYKSHKKIDFFVALWHCADNQNSAISISQPILSISDNDRQIQGLVANVPHFESAYPGA